MRFQKTKKHITFASIIGTIALTSGVLGLNGYFGGGAGSEAFDAATLTRGLVGYWQFEEGTGTTAADSTDQGNNGTLNAMDPSVDWVAGKIGGALDFDGSDDYVEITNDASLNFGAGQSFSASAWVKFSGTGATQTIFRTGVSSSYWYFERRSDNTIIFQTTMSGADPFIQSTTNQGTTDWHHVVVVRDGSVGSVAIYIDSVSEGTQSGANNTASVAGSADYRIGGRQSGGEFLEGQVDDLRIYNRALSAAEVKFLYNRGGPVSHWRFDEGSGTTTVFDSAGSNDGTMTNMEEADWVQGKFGTALDFDGSDDHVRVTDSASLDVSGDTITLSAWIKPGSSTDRVIFGKPHTSTHTSPFFKYSLYYAGAGGARQMTFRIDSTEILSGSGSTCPQDTWCHVVGVYDGSTMRIYLDGSERNSASKTGNVQTSDEDLYVAQNVAGGERFEGLIDDVRIYNYARTPEEIRLDYNAGLASRFGGSPAEDVERGLVGHWQFEDGSGTTATDSSDQGNNGTLTNMDPSVDWVAAGTPPISSAFGLEGGVLEFDGSNDYVDVGDQSVLDITANMTISMWLKYDSNSTNAARLVGKDKDTNTNEWVISLNGSASSTAKLQSRFLLSGTYYQDVTSSAVLNRDTWHFVAVVFSGGDTVVHYVDGVKPALSTGSGNVFAHDNFRIGWGDNAGQEFGGQLDDVRVYDRALSDAELNYLYNKGGSAVHWKFDEGSGTTAYDGAGSNDGTLQNEEESDWVQGKFGTAITFDGSNEHVTTTYGPDFSSEASFTLAAWFKSTATDGTIFGAITDTGGNDEEIYLRLDDTNCDAGELVFYVRDTNAVAADFICTQSAYNDNEWHHIEGVYDDDNNIMYLYIDGVLEGTTAITANSDDFMDFSSYPFYIAAENVRGSPATYFNGSLDDVKAYTYVRTPSQIQEDYNAGLATRFGGSPAEWVTQGLVGHWQFEDGSGTTATDSSDQGNDGTLTSMDPSVDWIAAGTPPISSVFGFGGSALDFDGSNDYVDLGSPASLDLETTFTLSVWVNQDTHGDVRVYSAGATDWGLRITNSGIWYFTDFGVADYAADTTLSNGTWYHLVIVKDGNSGTNVSFYLNGVPDGTASVGSTPISGTKFIGARNASSNFFNGQIDDVRLYNRALTAEEVRYLYNKGGPIAHWKFDEGSGTTTTFDSAGSNDGTMNGSMTEADWVQGKFGTALDFDGTNDYIDTSYEPVLSSESISFTLWMEADIASAGVQDMLLGARAETGANDEVITLEFTTSDTIQFAARDTDSSTGDTVASSGTYRDGTWHHIAAVFDIDTSLMTIYVDGQKDGVGAITSESNGDYDFTSYPFAIAAQNDEGSTKLFFDGVIDDVRIYRYARTAEEIRLDYNAGLSTHFR